MSSSGIMAISFSVLSAFSLLITCSTVAFAANIIYDGRYSGTLTPTNAGVFNGVSCSNQQTSATMTIQQGNITLLLNPSTNLIFVGAVSDDGMVMISGRNDRGSAGMSLSGRVANGQFDGRTAGLTCNSELHLRKN